MRESTRRRLRQAGKVACGGTGLDAPVVYPDALKYSGIDCHEACDGAVLKGHCPLFKTYVESGRREVKRLERDTPHVAAWTNASVKVVPRLASLSMLGTRISSCANAAPDGRRSIAVPVEVHESMRS
jgi:hypothetical protein